jgi:hypothetical protein
MIPRVVWPAMRDDTCPSARFQRFETVLIANGRMGDRFSGQRGTVIWCDRPWFSRRAGAWAEWGYCVSFPSLECCRSFLESDLIPTGEFDTEQSQLGTRYEISYDTVMGDDMGFVEGSYRLPGCLWQVFLFTNEDVPELRHSFGTWASGITGVEFKVPRGAPINHDYIVKAMSEVFGADSWAVVNGPDSLVLK